MTLSDQPDQGLQRPLTVSLGMALCQPSPDVQASQLFEAADQALYEAKRSGRNRVCLAGPLGPPQQAAA
jgi:diguanylate cyclase (GGDEF)-like protein